jgi:thymidylate kinase
MILSFKERFVEPIKNGTKIHTIREDKHNRWKAGMKIHFWKGNPRNVTKNPYQFAESVVYKVSNIEIFPSQNRIQIQDHYFDSRCALNDIARNDGFKLWEEMKEFFPEDFKGKLIFWEGARVLR